MSDTVTPTPELGVQVGALLTALRGDTSRAAQARDLGFSRSQLARLELGEWNITLARLGELAERYGVTLVVSAVDRETGAPLP